MRGRHQRYNRPCKRPAYEASTADWSAECMGAAGVAAALAAYVHPKPAAKRQASRDRADQEGGDDKDQAGGSGGHQRIMREPTAASLRWRRLHRHGGRAGFGRRTGRGAGFRRHTSLVSMRASIASSRRWPSAGRIAVADDQPPSCAARRLNAIQRASACEPMARCAPQPAPGAGPGHLRVMAVSAPRNWSKLAASICGYPPAPPCSRRPAVLPRTCHMCAERV